MDLLTNSLTVDIGDRVDVTAIDQGYVIEKGCSKVKQFGGAAITDSLAKMVSEKGHRFVVCFVLINVKSCILSFFSTVESYIPRHIKEKLAYGTITDKQQ